MHERLPKELQDAMARLLDAEIESERSPQPANRVARIRVLRTARAVVNEWREGRLTTEQAVSQLEALAASLR